MEPLQLPWITGYIWGIAEQVGWGMGLSIKEIHI